MNSLTLFPIEDFPLVKPGDDIAALIVGRLAVAGQSLQEDDVLVIAQKIVSKAEDRLVLLEDVEPSEEALRIAGQTDKDARHVQVVLDDSRSVIRARPGLLITEQSAGWICAHSGVDRSNVEQGENGEVQLAMLPLDGDASAERIRTRLEEITGVAPAVIINDSHNRPWRMGTVGISIGCAGVPPIWDQRGLTDLFGYELKGSDECIMDELAAAASLLMGQSDEGNPVVVIRGYRFPADAPIAPAKTIQRDAARDAFR